MDIVHEMWAQVLSAPLAVNYGFVCGVMWLCAAQGLCHLAARFRRTQTSSKVAVDNRIQ